ncbi:hypothetical protein PInf_021724 [Phytophthora infestans]|nr:hypothetical protein PInf_021724 [Phytophthora infestans]
MGSGSYDLSGLFDSESESHSASSGSKDTVQTKGGKVTKAPVENSSEKADVLSAKGKAVEAPFAEDNSEPGSGDLSWLFDSDSDSGSEDPPLAKGDTKGKTTKGPSGSHKLDLFFASEPNSGSEDTALIKGGKTAKTSKILVEEDSASVSTRHRGTRPSTVTRFTRATW